MCMIVWDYWEYPSLYKVKYAAFMLQLVKVVLPLININTVMDTGQNITACCVCGCVQMLLHFSPPPPSFYEFNVETSALPPMLWMERDKWSGASTRGQTSPAHLDRLTWLGLPRNRQTCRKRCVQEPVQSTGDNNQNNKMKPTFTYTCLNGAVCLYVVATQKGKSVFSNMLTIRENQVREELTLTTVALGWFWLFACLDSIKTPEVTTFIYRETTRTCNISVMKISTVNVHKRIVRGQSFNHTTLRRLAEYMQACTEENGECLGPVLR